jgi:hypothetical protein
MPLVAARNSRVQMQLCGTEIMTEIAAPTAMTLKS